MTGALLLVLGVLLLAAGGEALMRGLLAAARHSPGIGLACRRGRLLASSAINVRSTFMLMLPA